MLAIEVDVEQLVVPQRLRDRGDKIEVRHLFVTRLRDSRRPFGAFQVLDEGQRASDRGEQDVSAWFVRFGSMANLMSYPGPRRIDRGRRMPPCIDRAPPGYPWRRRFQHLRDRPNTRRSAPKVCGEIDIADGLRDRETTDVRSFDVNAPSLNTGCVKQICGDHQERPLFSSAPS